MMEQTAHLTEARKQKKERERPKSDDLYGGHTYSDLRPPIRSHLSEVSHLPANIPILQTKALTYGSLEGIPDPNYNRSEELQVDDPFHVS